MDIDGIVYNIKIIKKNNKNTYIRIDENKNIVVTTNYFVSKNKINNLLIENKEVIKKMLLKQCKREKQNEKFRYLGNNYDIILMSNIENIEIYDNKILIKDTLMLEKWLKKRIIELFSLRLKEVYDSFEEDIYFPKLKIRKMKTRWGVCNKNKSITLNSELIKYDIKVIDYVIIHELSHIVYFNHSKDFWHLVEKYCSNYKEIKKILKN